MPIGGATLKLVEVEEYQISRGSVDTLK